MGQDVKMEEKTHTKMYQCHKEKPRSTQRQRSVLEDVREL